MWWGVALALAQAAAIPIKIGSMVWWSATRSRVVVQFDSLTCGFTPQSEPLPVQGIGHILQRTALVASNTPNVNMFLWAHISIGRGSPGLQSARRCSLLRCQCRENRYCATNSLVSSDGILRGDIPASCHPSLAHISTSSRIASSLRSPESMSSYHLAGRSFDA